jgi:aspartyl/asparaginyl beta-hydroxylase (cupin superfamily)
MTGLPRTVDAVPLSFRLLHRFERYLAHASLLGDPPVHDPRTFGWVPALEAAVPDMVAEYRRLVDGGEPIPPFHEISPEQLPITADDRWRTFVLHAYGIEAPRNAALCPRTAAAVRAVPGMQTAMFSILEPGKRLAPHRGPYKGLLRVQVALELPAEREACWIEVDGIRMHWQHGRTIVFDDTRVHSAANESAQRRCVLFMDILRPMHPFADRLNRTLLWLLRRSQFGRRAQRVFADWYRRHGIVADA